MDISVIGNYFDIGIIIGIILITSYIKDALHKKTKLDNEETIDSKIIPFVPLVLGIFAGVSVVFRDAKVANNFWNIIWASIKYAGAATFAYKLFSKFGKAAIEKVIKRKIG